jgi:phosphonate transport system substrate-binding protein
MWRMLAVGRWIGVLATALLLLATVAQAAPPLRIGLTPTFLQGRHALVAQWQDYLQGKLGRPVSFVSRESYRDTIDLMRRRQLDAAWLCDCPYATDNPEFHLLATPVFNGRPYYRAYLIVPARDRTTQGIGDLKGKVFAYADPYSNAGYLTPRHDVRALGADPDSHFRRTFHAWSHGNAIAAVADGLADGASVNSYIWETLHKQSPALTSRTRVAGQSPEYGFAPLVAHHALAEPDFLALRRALLEMNQDVAGRALLEKMNLDGFIPPRAEYYQRVRELVESLRGDAHASF